MIFQGFKTDNLFLSGANGTGKTLISKLVVEHLTSHCPTLLISDPIEIVMAQKDIHAYFMNAHHFAYLAGARSNDRVVIVFDELEKFTGSLDKLWTVMDRLKEHLLVIITTNEPMKFQNAVRSRCDKFNFTRIKPDEFLARAQFILNQEHVDLADAHVLHYLKTMTVTTSDVRDYCRVLDKLIFWSQHGIPLPTVPTQQTAIQTPTLAIAK